MQISMPEVFLGLAVAIYIFMLLDRVCKCFETCANHKTMAAMYRSMNSEVIKDIYEKTKEK